MRAAFATLALAVLTAASPAPAPAGVSSAIAPSSSSPAGCSPNYSGTFSIAAVNVSQSSESKRHLEERAGALAISLSNGVLTDSAGRTGYVASNSQFQFDKPPQAGAIFTSGFSVCSNGSLAIGTDAIWYQCLSGDFYNLYLHNDGAQCVPAYLVTSPLSGGGPQSGSVTPTGVTTASTAANATATMTATAVTGAGNHTTIINSSGTAFNLPSNTTSTATAGSTSVIGGHTTVMGGHTTVMGGHTTVIAGGHQTTKMGGQASSTMGSGSGSGGSGSGGSSSSSASTGAAPTGQSRGEKLGLAVGLLAFAVL